jgi:hypothetical protein
MDEIGKGSLELGWAKHRSLGGVSLNASTNLLGPSALYSLVPRQLNPSRLQRDRQKSQQMKQSDLNHSISSSILMLFSILQKSRIR